MKRTKIYRSILLLLAILSVLSLLAGCGVKKQKEFVIYRSFSELKHKRIGVLSGSVQAQMVEERFPDAKILYYNNGVDMLSALKTGKIDAYADLEEFVRYLMPDNDNLTYLDEKLSDGGEVGAIFSKTEKGKQLRDEFSEFIVKLKGSGEYEKIKRKWFEEEEDATSVPLLYKLDGKNGTIRMAADTSNVPFFTIKNRKPIGIDVDVATRFCMEKGYGLEIAPMDMESILPSVATSQCDFACGGIAYTKERAENVLYSELTYEGASVIAILNEPPEYVHKTFWISLKEGFEKTFLREERYELLLEGTETTILITVLSVPLGTLLGILFYILWLRRNKIFTLLTEGFLWILRGMPEVVLLLILYYVIFGKSDFSSVFIAVVCFSLTFAVSMFGMLRSGVDSVNPGQIEAGYALGYSRRKAFLRFVLPQAAMSFMPTYEAEVISLIKGTSVVGYIAVQDLTKMGDIIRSRTYEAFFPLIVVTVIYFILFWFVARLIEFVIRKINPKNRTPEQFLKGVRIHD